MPQLNFPLNAFDTLEMCQPFLLEAEAENNLLFGLLADTQPGGYFAVFEESHHVEGLAVMQPRHKLMLSKGLDGAMVAQDLFERRLKVHAVFGPKSEVNSFKDAWVALTKRPASPGVSQRVYELETLTRPECSAPGLLRKATADDQFLESWLTQFLVDSQLSSSSVEVKKLLTDLLARESLFLWQEKEPVAMAAILDSTPNGMRLGLIFTPRRFRKQGFASACLAGVSQEVFNRGKKYCFLFADIENPVSNRIYQKLGYRPLSECLEWRFSYG